MGHFPYYSIFKIYLGVRYCAQFSIGQKLCGEEREDERGDFASAGRDRTLLVVGTQFRRAYHAGEAVVARAQSIAALASLTR
jgi:hypothetical protein